MEVLAWVWSLAKESAGPLAAGSETRSPTLSESSPRLLLPILLQIAPALTAPSTKTQQPFNVAASTDKAGCSGSPLYTEATSRSPPHATSRLLVSSVEQAAGPQPEGTTAEGGGCLPAPVLGDARLPPAH